MTFGALSGLRDAGVFDSVALLGAMRAFMSNRFSSETAETNAGLSRDKWGEIELEMVMTYLIQVLKRRLSAPWTARSSRSCACFFALSLRMSPLLACELASRSCYRLLQQLRSASS